MGEAEDILFSRKRAEDAAHEQKERQEAVDLRNNITALMPESIENLRQHNYVFASQCHVVMSFQGEDRVGWAAHNGQYGDTPCGHDIFVLGDGTIVNRSGHNTRIVDLNILPLQCLKEVWQTVWAMANHKKR